MAPEYVFNCGRTVSKMVVTLMTSTITCPSKVILHAGYNDTTIKDISLILQNLLRLKFHFNDRHPNLITSCPIIRTDNHAANITLRNLLAKLKDLEISIIDNEILDIGCLGKGGLHLNDRSREG